jgi:hypothetical protein
MQAAIRAKEARAVARADLLTVRLLPELEFIIGRFEESLGRRLDADELLTARKFLNWLFGSGEMITKQGYKNEMDRLRFLMSGDAQFLARLNSVGKGSVSFQLRAAASKNVIGEISLQPGQLPKGLRESELLTVKISRPHCRVCGCRNERVCKAGCFFNRPDLCSGCEVKRARERIRSRSYLKSRARKP